jgi:hypothetical protein
MSFKKVKELRQNGELEAAYQLAKLDLEAVMGGDSEPVIPVELKVKSLSQSGKAIFTTCDKVFPIWNLKQAVEQNWATLGEDDTLTVTGEIKYSENLECHIVQRPQHQHFLIIDGIPHEPEDIQWAKRSMAWVLYEYLKRSASAAHVEAFAGWLKELAALQLNKNENMIFDSVAWQVGKLLYDLHRQEKVDYTEVDTVFSLVQEFHFTKPSKAYTFLYKAFHKAYTNWQDYLRFADWWGFDNFRPEDYLKEEMPNGRSVMSIAEQAYIAYAKKLLEGEPSDFNRFRNYVNPEKVEAFMPALDALIEKHPEFLYPPYFKARLLLAIGSDENILEAFLPFAKAKRNDFWVWDVLADIFPDEPEKQIACLCRALTCRTQDEFLINVRTKLAGLLIEAGQFPEARTEIEHILKTMEEQGWSLAGKLKKWQGTTWYKETKPLDNNHRLYSANAGKAEELLFADIPAEVAVVEYVNRDRKILHFIVNQARHGHLKYDRFLRKVDIGDCIEVRLEGPSGDRYFKALTLKKTEREPDASILKNFAGILSLRPGNSFGFVEDVFVEPGLISRYGLSDGAVLSGRALQSFNKKKNDWGWKVLEITKD